jgi:NADPH:quinone reductase-like Zn-dependent oxidoreductase
VIDRVMPLSDGRAAYALLESGDHFGKLVLVP